MGTSQRRKSIKTWVHSPGKTPRKKETSKNSGGVWPLKVNKKRKEEREGGGFGETPRRKKNAVNHKKIKREEKTRSA